MLHRHLRLYLAFVLVAALLMTYQSNRGALRPFAIFSYTINNINKSITLSHQGIDRAIRAVRDNEQEFQRLRGEIRDLRARIMDYDEIVQENRRLRDLLSFKIAEPRQVATATVISRSALRWSNSLMIDKGTLDGVGKDMAVITPDGLVGKVLEARPYYSLVLLITDSRFAAAIRLQGSREEAMLVGDGGGCFLRYLSSDAPVAEGDILVTSGLDALFPSGIPAATVKLVYTAPKELFHTVQAQPLASLNRLEEVIVVER